MLNYSSYDIAGQSAFTLSRINNDGLSAIATIYFNCKYSSAYSIYSGWDNYAEIALQSIYSTYMLSSF